MTTSSLDGIPGLGEARRKKLVTALGGVGAVKKASLDTLQSLTFLPDAVAEAIYARFHPDDGTPVAPPRSPSAAEGAHDLGVEAAERVEALLGRGAEGEVGEDELVDTEVDVAADPVDELRG
jgi:hypothetical protein